MSDKLTREKVYQDLQDELKTMKKMKRMSQEQRERHDEYRMPLSIDKTQEYKILLSWGGPEDGFKLRFQGHELVSGVYYGANWGEYEEVELMDEEAQMVYQFYMGGEEPLDP